MYMYAYVYIYTHRVSWSRQSQHSAASEWFSIPFSSSLLPSNATLSSGQSIGAVAVPLGAPLIEMDGNIASSIYTYIHIDTYIGFPGGGGSWNTSPILMYAQVLRRPILRALACRYDSRL